MLCYTGVVGRGLVFYTLASVSLQLLSEFTAAGIALILGNGFAARSVVDWPLLATSPRRLLRRLCPVAARAMRQLYRAFGGDAAFVDASGAVAAVQCLLLEAAGAASGRPVGELAALYALLFMGAALERAAQRGLWIPSGPLARISTKHATWLPRALYCVCMLLAAPWMERLTVPLGELTRWWVQ
jgi:hypothetical protein